MINKIRITLKFDNPNPDSLEELDQVFEEIDYQTVSNTVRYIGSREKLQEVLRYCNLLDLKVKK